MKIRRMLEAKPGDERKLDFERLLILYILFINNKMTYLFAG
jgi:hypothetical protein